MKRLKWVYGNTLPMAVSMYEVVVTENGITRQPYIAPEGSTIQVSLVGAIKRTYEPTVNGNVLTFTDDGTLPVGKYGIEIKVTEPTKNLRSFKCGKFFIIYSSDDMNVGEFLASDAVTLDTETFFWAQGEKGDKGDTGATGEQGPQGPQGEQGPQGDPLTYDDLTPAQKADLTQNCYTKVPNISITEQDGIMQKKNNETFPVAHPDISSEPQLLPYKWNGYKVYERTFQTQSTSFSFNLGSVNFSVIEAHCFKLNDGAHSGIYRAVLVRHIGIGWWEVICASTPADYQIEIGDYLTVRYIDLNNQ